MTGGDRRRLAVTTSEGLWQLQVHQELAGCYWVQDIEIRVNSSWSCWLQTLLRKYCKMCWQGTPFEYTVKHEAVGQLEQCLWNKLHWGHFGSVSKEDIQLKRLHVFVHILASVLQRKVSILFLSKFEDSNLSSICPFYKVLISCQILDTTLVSTIDAKSDKEYKQFLILSQNFEKGQLRFAMTVRENIP